MSWRTFEDVKTNIFALVIQDVLKTFCSRAIYSSWSCVRRFQDVVNKSCKNIFKTSSRRPQDVLSTSLRCLQSVFKTFQNVFKTSCKNVFKTFSRRLQEILKTSSRYHQEVFQICLSKPSQEVSPSSTVLLTRFRSYWIRFLSIYGQCTNFAKVIKISQVLLFQFTKPFSRCLQRRT